MLLGCIGDDFTGSSDLANTLAKGGMRVTQYSGIPSGDAAQGVEAGVISLKSRTIPVEDAVRQSLAALEWLAKQGCRQFFFKYCSTFDSTADGNIGPVAEAMANALNADRVIVCPAFPATGRSVYQGHLFVADQLLSESGMEHHPLTPMTDSDLRRWLAPQTTLGVGHINAQTVGEGADAIRAALADERDGGRALIIVDAIRDADLIEIGAAAADLPLVTGGSGVALGLPENFRRQGQLVGNSAEWQGSAGRAAILSGSCSNATREQVSRHDGPMIEIRATDVITGDMSGPVLAEWMLAQRGVPLGFSSADPNSVREAQEAFGKDLIASVIERVFADAARILTADGITRLIVAGGETSGAVVEALQVEALDIGPEIDPGVPALRVAGRDLTLALKSGNFGAPDFFAKAAAVLGS